MYTNEPCETVSYLFTVIYTYNVVETASGIQDVAVTALRLASRVTTGDRLTLVDDGDIEAESSRRTR